MAEHQYGEVIQFPPPQGDATAAAPPPTAAVQPPPAPLVEQLRAQLDTLTHAMATAVGRLGALPNSAVDPEVRRGLVSQYRDLSDFATQLYERLVTTNTETGQTFGIDGEVMKFQEDVQLFLGAVESQIAAVTGGGNSLAGLGQTPNGNGVPQATGRWMWWVGAAVLVGGIGWWVLSQRDGPTPAY